MRVSITGPASRLKGHCCMYSWLLFKGCFLRVVCVYRMCGRLRCVCVSVFWVTGMECVKSGAESPVETGDIIERLFGVCCHLLGFLRLRGEK